MKGKFESMKRAMEELEKGWPHLAREANRRLPGLFPREMRPPTDTPAIGGWKHDWRPSISRIH